MNKLFCLIEQRVPIIYINIDEQCLTYESQIIITDFLKPILSVNAYYVKNFLRFYISKLEKSGEETSDELYELFVDPILLKAKELNADTPDILKYYINGLNEESNDENDSVLIKETPRLISGNNTTGLRTWEAALFLSNYLNDKQIRPYDLKDKRVLELGCGTGLISLSLAKNYHNKIGKLDRTIMTDGSSNVFDNMNESLSMNKLGNSLISCQQLIWGEENNVNDIDLLLGADITYDSRILEPLCSTINQFFNRGLSLCLIAATVRNEETLNNWEKELNKWFLNRWKIAKVFKVNETNSQCWFDPNTPDIKLYEIVNS
ncbi:unnamed protein product [Candida verbasci]|uniref:Uncharacterized protein n=1 Tax=Candida verbasci TaxID=1227364 RepID=A0A9W4X955_9ASCO|nr:unnamed protein product [Candida verbasci]